MKKHAFRKDVLSDFLAGGFFLLLLLLVILVYRFPGVTVYAPAVDPFFLMQPETDTTESIDDYAGVQRTYTFTVQHDVAVRRGASLFVWLRHTYATVLLDGEVRYDSLPDGSARVGKTPGNYWLTVPLREDYIGKTVTVTLTPVYSSVRDEVPRFFQISRDSLMNMMLLPQDLGMVLLGAVAAAAGLFMIPLVFTLPIDGGDKRKIVYLGAVTICAGLWKLSSLQLLLLLLDRYGRQREIWYLGTSAYLLMLVLSLRLQGLLRTEGENRISRLCFYLGAGTAVLLVLLQLAGLAEIHDWLLWYGFFMAALHLVSLLGEKPSRQELLWLLPTFLALGIDLLFYLRTGSIRNAPVFLCWILLNLFIRGFGMIRTAIRRERQLRLQEEELRDAKVRAMMNQIQPHFIYNTLVSIYALCEDDPSRAMDVIQNFTTYLEANFSAITSKELIAFSAELENTRAYLNVEKVMLEDRLQVEYDTPYTAFRLPPMTLQPVVENAVKYGKKCGEDLKRIVIRSLPTEDAALVIVEDNGPGFDPDAVDSGDSHIGLQNVRERLRLMCGGTLEIRSTPGSGTVVTIRIPNRTEKEKPTTESPRKAGETRADQLDEEKD